MPTRKQTRQGHADALIKLAPTIPHLVVLDADVARATKTCDFAAKYAVRFFNCGTAEQNELGLRARDIVREAHAVLAAGSVATTS